MNDVALPKGLRGQLAWLWAEETDKPRALILLVVPGCEPGSELRSIADELQLQFITIHLNQVVTPEQHMNFTQDKPRLVAISGIDRLTPGERDAFVRLVHNGPRTLPVILCPVALEQARDIARAWAAVRDIETSRNDREARRIAIHS